MPSLLSSGGITGFVLKRLLIGVMVLVVVSVIVFAATQALPGDPAQAILGRSATPQALAALRRQLHLNQPVLSQYWHWIDGLLHGHPGISLAAQEPVTKLLSGRLENSAFLVLVSGAVSIPLSVAIGAYAAFKRDRTFDVATSVGLLALAALPEFVVAIILVILLATTVTHLLPAVTSIAPSPVSYTHLAKSASTSGTAWEAPRQASVSRRSGPCFEQGERAHLHARWVPAERTRFDTGQRGDRGAGRSPLPQHPAPLQTGVGRPRVARLGQHPRRGGPAGGRVAQACPGGWLRR